jgi:hypothetical protein
MLRSSAAGEAMFFVILFLILFGITLAGVCGFYLARLAGVYLGGNPFSVIEKKGRAAMRAAHLGWVAMIAGPIVAFLISLATLPQLHKSEPNRGVFRDVMLLFLITGLGAVAGVIAGGAFWMTSAILGKVSNWGKKTRSPRDPDFDGPV